MIKIKITVLTEKGKAAVKSMKEPNRGGKIIQKLGGITAEEKGKDLIVSLSKFDMSVSKLILNSYVKSFKKLDLKNNVDYSMELIK